MRHVQVTPQDIHLARRHENGQRLAGNVGKSEKWVIVRVPKTLQTAHPQGVDSARRERTVVSIPKTVVFGALRLSTLEDEERLPVEEITPPVYLLAWMGLVLHSSRSWRRHISALAFSRDQDRFGVLHNGLVDLRRVAIKRRFLNASTTWSSCITISTVKKFTKTS